MTTARIHLQLQTYDLDTGKPVYDHTYDYSKGKTIYSESFLVTKNTTVYRKIAQVELSSDMTATIVPLDNSAFKDILYILADSGYTVTLL